MDPLPAAALLSRALAERRARVAVGGRGYAGLPLAEAFVAAGFPVLGHDVDEGKVGSLRQGRSYLGHVPDGRVAALLATGRFEATTDAARLASADAVIVCVPTPLSEALEPDLSDVVAATGSVAAGLHRGMLVVLSSTTYPGTTRDVL